MAARWLGLAGTVAAPILSVTTEMGLQFLIPSLIGVVIGGLGSLKGAGSFLYGFMATLGAAPAPAVASVVIYARLAAVQVLRPTGLFPATA